MGRARVEEAELLFQHHRYDTAVYLCGYAVEFYLKARICTTLKWQGFPSEDGEWSSVKFLKVHDLEMLLRLSGREKKVKATLFADWSFVKNNWGSDSRYVAVGTKTMPDARQLIDAVGKLMKVL
jgi:HEPN domain-containing protein